MEGISLRPVYGKKPNAPVTTSSTAPTNNTTTSNNPPIKSSSSKEKEPTKTYPSSTSSQPKSEQNEQDNSDLSKFIYSRTFIKQLQSQCTECPTELQATLAEVPELKSVHRAPTSTSTKPGSPQSPRRDGKDQSKQQGNKPYGKKKQQQQQQQQPGPAVPPSANQKDKPAAWNPVFFVDQKEQTLRTIKGTLNKLTPETFEKLTHKIAEMISQLTDEEAYKEAVSMVFYKAVSEINFTHMYTKLCVKLNESEPKFANSQLTFRRILLSLNQHEFEAANNAVDEASLPEDPDERAVVKEKERRRKIGNVKFIGELFNEKLLSEVVVNECLKFYFNYIMKHKGEEERMDREFAAELLCKLLTTVGGTLDTQRAKQWMDTYFNLINQYSS